MSLTDTERAALDFAGRTYIHQGVREADVRKEFGWSLVRYHQVLDALLDRDEAMAHAPAVVGRLRRLRELRARARAPRTDF